ncbi:cytochrome P450 [Boletus coccyginus]|nr:cytochrome P450 [Boletus coccyginus]
MFDWTTTGSLVLGGVVVIYIARRALGTGTSYPLPPGPPGLPEWARAHGGLVYSRLFGKDIIIISSEKIAKDLLENRSKIYSDRPYLLTHEMSGVDWVSTPLFCLTVIVGDCTGAFSIRHFDSMQCTDFYPSKTARHAISSGGCCDSPEQLSDHLFEYTAAVIMNSTYDYDPASRNDELVDIVARVLDIVVPVLRPDFAVIVGAFPWLLHLPSWFPGMSFKREMVVARELSKQYLDRPFEHALQKVPNGGTVPSMVQDALREMEKKGVSPEESWMDALKEASGSAFLAASETSKSVLMTFFLMMVLYQRVQEIAQAEIDAVVGKDRLPTMEDRPWLPHATVDDDVYGGFHIPKGAIVITNLWGMAHDESRYPDPDAFIPERFLNDDGSLKPNDVGHIMYGFGRRICVGRHFADTSVWSVIAKVLAVFKILGPLDENGVKIPVEPRFTTGNVIHPLPFRCRIVPRFPGMDAEKLEQLIAATTA